MYRAGGDSGAQPTVVTFTGPTRHLSAVLTARLNCAAAHCQPTPQVPRLALVIPRYICIATAHLHAQPLTLAAACHALCPHLGCTLLPAAAQVLRFAYGEADYDPYADTAYTAKRAFATMYFITYWVAVVLLLGNLLVAIIIHTYQAVHEGAENVWRLRWASYVLK